MKRYVWLVVVVSLLLCLPGCAKPPMMESVEFLVGVSLANTREPWRLQLSAELVEEAKKHPEIRLVVTDASDDQTKQTEDIARLQQNGIDLLIVSPCNVESFMPTLSQVYEDLPVIVLDRMVEGYDYSLFIGPDNIQVGTQAGEVVKEIAQEKPTKVLELMGMMKSSESRTKGFSQVVAPLEYIDVEKIQLAQYTRDCAEDMVLALGKHLLDVDVIFAHNDYMALGAHRALKTLGYNHIHIVGIDGFTGADGGLEMVRSGAMDATITCPTGGAAAIQNAIDILKDVHGVPKQIILRNHTVTQENLKDYEAFLYQDPVERPTEIVIGHVQTGVESGWRLANHKSIQQAAKDTNITIISANANQSQAAQIAAMEDFIAQGVDAIVLSPLVTSGWAEILEKARVAQIPVMLSDRRIEDVDLNAYATFVGTDPTEEGRQAMAWALEYIPTTEKAVSILEVAGTEGSSSAIERSFGFRGLMEQSAGYEITDVLQGDFTQESGYELLKQSMEENGLPWDLIFCHNDDMALGVIAALRESGYQPGVDVKIISIDGTQKALEALQQGDLNCVVECNPLLGPQLMKAVIDDMTRNDLALRIITDGMVFTQDTPTELFQNRQY